MGQLTQDEQHDNDEEEEEAEEQEQEHDGSGADAQDNDDRLGDDFVMQSSIDSLVGVQLIVVGRGKMVVGAEVHRLLRVPAATGAAPEGERIQCGEVIG